MSGVESPRGARLELASRRAAPAQLRSNSAAGGVVSDATRRAPGRRAPTWLVLGARAAAVAVAWKRASGQGARCDEMASTLEAANAALLAAATAGDAADVRAALDAGANVNCATKDLVFTPTHLAAEHGHAAVVSLLLERGADLEANVVGSFTPLHRAAEYGHESLVSLLLGRGAAVEAKDFLNWTPLFLAAQNGHESVVTLLLAHGADSSANDFGDTPLLLAAKNGHESVVTLLLKQPGVDVDARDEGGWTPLHVAAENGHTSVVVLLLERSADLEAKKVGGRTPLHSASLYGHASIMAALLERGADILAEDDEGTKPVHLAAHAGHTCLDAAVGARLGHQYDRKGRPDSAARGLGMWPCVFHGCAVRARRRRGGERLAWLDPSACGFV